MTHPVSKETPKSKCPYLWLSTFLVLAYLFHMSSGIDVTVFKAVKEMVALSCGYQIPLAELSTSRIYWQKDNQVVLSITSGVLKVWPEYKNRTFFDSTNNLSLVILNLHLSDEGTYTCVVQKKIDQTYKLEHLRLVALYVRADFPTPSITESGDPSPDIKRITCSASGGSPKPHLSWLENGEDIKTHNTTISQDHETKMFTITSQLDFNITIDHIFLCSIQYGDFRVSQNFTWHASASEQLPNKQPSWLVIIVVVLVAIIST
ncbi:T-lymphocyte activation antigen CD80 isoform X1 [Dipodomys merriami]|uniref:T-lymphocyte activation antigen CD80 isoform X1 n=1 Tax=Dipodomys merriami TaxID=94247 RepID=UPI00385577C3